MGGSPNANGQEGQTAYEEREEYAGAKQQEDPRGSAETDGKGQAEANELFSRRGSVFPKFEPERIEGATAFGTSMLLGLRKVVGTIRAFQIRR